MADKIIIKGARVNNLKNVNVEIPKNKLVVVTGLSGSGKSSLAFDTIYAEGQRQYLESLSPYARQILGIKDKPEVDQIEGLSPVIAIDQRKIFINPRSTVGTVTEIYDYFRLLYSKAGRVHCPECGDELKKLTLDQITGEVLNWPEKSLVKIFSPIIIQKKITLDDLSKKIKKSKYKYFRLDGIEYGVNDIKNLYLDENQPHDLDLLIDQVLLERKKDLSQTTLFQILKIALDLSNGHASVLDTKTEKELNFHQRFFCQKCQLELPDLELRSFSYNSPYGACPECTGLGVKLIIDPDLLIFNPKLTIPEGAIKVWSRLAASQQILNKLLEALAKENRINLKTPVDKLSKEKLNILLYGSENKEFEIKGKKHSFSGIIPFIEQKYKETDSDYLQKEIENCLVEVTCPLCEGKRLKKEILAVTLAQYSIANLVNYDLKKLKPVLEEIFENKKKLLSKEEMLIAKPILEEVIKRIDYLFKVSLEYLTLDRSTVTLSGGELQRIRLATQLGSSLTGLIYILDEPTIGLHPKNTQKLIEILKKLRDIGNTVIVVEHDEMVMKEADYIFDLGPGAGELGGELVAEGTFDQILKNKESLTGLYLSNKYKIESPKKERKKTIKYLTVEGAKENNLKNLTVKIPLGQFVGITGVSGSGKSSLVDGILAKVLKKHFYRAKVNPGEHKAIKGLENLDKAIVVDQSPIGRTPRSNPATYTGIFNQIRDLFANLPESKMRGFDAGRFSFNVVGGRCETCSGEGFVKIEMQFLPDVYAECEECRGKRYNRETLEIYYKDKNIADVLSMTIEEARRFFSDVPALYEKLNLLYEVGLGYLKLGQPATTLSGGEAQRVKLATELSRRSTGNTLYILDEPTTGLHFDDINRLLRILNRLVNKGNTVLIIEHNTDVINACDWIIDLGPEGGDLGGEIVAQGTPRDIAKEKRSFTGKYLK